MVGLRSARPTLQGPLVSIGHYRGRIRGVTILRAARISGARGRGWPVETKKSRNGELLVPESLTIRC